MWSMQRSRQTHLSGHSILAQNLMISIKAFPPKTQSTGGRPSASSRKHISKQPTELNGARCPTLRFLKGGIPLLSPAWDFLLTPAAPSFIECTDDPHHPPFSQRARKGWGTR